MAYEAVYTACKRKSKLLLAVLLGIVVVVLVVVSSRVTLEVKITRGDLSIKLETIR